MEIIQKHGGNAGQFRADGRRFAVVGPQASGKTRLIDRLSGGAAVLVDSSDLAAPRDEIFAAAIVHLVLDGFRLPETAFAFADRLLSDRSFKGRVMIEGQPHHAAMLEAAEWPCLDLGKVGGQQAPGRKVYPSPDGLCLILGQ